MSGGNTGRKQSRDPLTYQADAVLTKPESFYDRPALAEYLHNLK